MTDLRRREKTPPGRRRQEIPEKVLLLDRSEELGLKIEESRAGKLEITLTISGRTIKVSVPYSLDELERYCPDVKKLQEITVEQQDEIVSKILFLALCFTSLYSVFNLSNPTNEEINNLLSVLEYGEYNVVGRNVRLEVLDYLFLSPDSLPALGINGLWSTFFSSINIDVNQEVDGITVMSDSYDPYSSLNNIVNMFFYVCRRCSASDSNFYFPYLVFLQFYEGDDFDDEKLNKLCSAFNSLYDKDDSDRTLTLRIRALLLLKRYLNKLKEEDRNSFLRNANYRPEYYFDRRSAESQTFRFKKQGVEKTGSVYGPFIVKGSVYFVVEISIPGSEGSSSTRLEQRIIELSSETFFAFFRTRIDNGELLESMLYMIKNCIAQSLEKDIDPCEALTALMMIDLLTEAYNTPERLGSKLFLYLKSCVKVKNENDYGFLGYLEKQGVTIPVLQEYVRVEAGGVNRYEVDELVLILRKMCYYYAKLTSPASDESIRSISIEQFLRAVGDDPDLLLLLYFIATQHPDVNPNSTIEVHDQITVLHVDGGEKLTPALFLTLKRASKTPQPQQRQVTKNNKDIKPEYRPGLVIIINPKLYTTGARVSSASFLILDGDKPVKPTAEDEKKLRRKLVEVLKSFLGGSNTDPKLAASISFRKSGGELVEHSSFPLRGTLESLESAALTPSTTEKDKNDPSLDLDPNLSNLLGKILEMILSNVEGVNPVITYYYNIVGLNPNSEPNPMLSLNFVFENTDLLLYSGNRGASIQGNVEVCVTFDPNRGILLVEVPEVVIIETPSAEEKSKRRGPITSLILPRVARLLGIRNIDIGDTGKKEEILLTVEDLRIQIRFVPQQSSKGSEQLKPSTNLWPRQGSQVAREPQNPYIPTPTPTTTTVQIQAPPRNTEGKGRIPPPRRE